MRGAHVSGPTRVRRFLVVLVVALLAGWGYFIRCNRYAEELEPEAMAKQD